MKTITALVLILLSVQILADCISRPEIYRGGVHRPLFELVSCQPALDKFTEVVGRYNDEGVLGHTYKIALNGITSADLAIEVHPLTLAAKSLMYQKEKEYWHYSGSCKDIPLEKPVVLTLKQHCSDTGITLVGTLGDITIEEIWLRHYP